MNLVRPAPRRLHGRNVSSIIEDLAGTDTAKWLRHARASHRPAWDDRVRCFDALAGILSAYRPSWLGGRWGQRAISPAGLLKDVASRAHFSAEAVYQRWRAGQSDQALRRWAGPEPGISPREAFVCEAKIVSFWPYRAGALAIADDFEMTLTEVAASYLRALGAWAGDNLALAACSPAGPPPCVSEDVAVLARRRLGHATVGDPGFAELASRLGALVGELVAAILDDVSMTPLGAFNVIRDEAQRLLAVRPDPVAVTVSNAMSELADRILHRRDGEQVLTSRQARQLEAEMSGLAALLASASPEPDDAVGQVASR